MSIVIDKNLDITVVIRASNERTEKLCLAKVQEQVRQENIFVINEKPFSQAVRKNFQIGIDQNKKWTLALDADIILFSDSLSNMILEAEKLSDDYFVYQGWVYDHFFCEVRAGGPHLYRTSLLEKAISLIPQEGTSLRPESDTYHLMKNEGYFMYQDVRNFGLHDFEQSYFDIYRKFFLHAKKHHALVDTFLDGWKSQLTSTMDYIIAMRGLSDGLIYNDTVLVDTRFFENKASSIFNTLHLQEKDKIINYEKIEELLVKHKISDKFNKMQRLSHQFIVNTKTTEQPSFSLTDRILRKKNHLINQTRSKCAKVLISFANLLQTKC